MKNNSKTKINGGENSAPLNIGEHIEVLLEDFHNNYQLLRTDENGYKYYVKKGDPNPKYEFLLEYDFYDDNNPIIINIPTDDMKKISRVKRGQNKIAEIKQNNKLSSMKTALDLFMNHCQQTINENGKLINLCDKGVEDLINGVGPVQQVQVQGQGQVQGYQPVQQGHVYQGIGNHGQMHQVPVQVQQGPGQRVHFGQAQGQLPQVQLPQGQLPQGQWLQGQWPRGQLHQGQLPQGQWLQGQLPQVQLPQGQLRQGQLHQGQLPQGQWLQGQLPQGQWLQGQLPQGQWLQGQLPQGQWLQGQLPQGQLPQGQWLQGQLPQGQWPQVQWPNGPPAPKLLRGRDLELSRASSIRSVSVGGKKTPPRNLSEKRKMHKQINKSKLLFRDLLNDPNSKYVKYMNTLYLKINDTLLSVNKLHEFINSKNVRVKKEVKSKNKG